MEKKRKKETKHIGKKTPGAYWTWQGRVEQRREREQRPRRGRRLEHVRHGAQESGRNTEEFRVLGGTTGGRRAGGHGPHQTVRADCIWDGGLLSFFPPAVFLCNFLRFFFF